MTAAAASARERSPAARAEPRAPRRALPPALPRTADPGPRGPPPPRSRFGSPARRAPGCCLPGGPGAAAAPREPRRPAARPRRRRQCHGGRQARRADGHLLQLPGGDAALRVPGRRVPAARAARQAVQGQGPAAAAAPVPLQDAAGDLRRDPRSGGGRGVPHGGGKGQEVVPAEPGVPAPQHAEPVAAEGAAQQLQTEEQPGLQRLRLGPVRGAARPGTREPSPRGPAPRGPARIGTSRRAANCTARPAQRGSRAGARGGAGEGGRFLCPCKCLFFNSSQYGLCRECVREAPRAESALGRRGFPASRSTPLSDGLQVRFCTPLHRAPQRTPVHTHSNTLSLNTFIIVRRG